LILTGKVIHTVWGSGREPVNQYHEEALGPKTEDGRPKRSIINYEPIIFLPFMPTGKVADNQIE
jgi:hypothetical protein